MRLNAIGSSRQSLVGLAAAGLLAGASFALAQPGGGFGGGGNEIFEPSVTTQQMKTYSELLTLSPEQTDAANSLLEAYQLEFAAAAKPIRDGVEALRDEARQTRDRSIWEEIVRERDSFSEQREKMEQTFFQDVKLLLTEDQLEQWPRIERTRQRERLMPRGLMSGERVDVIQLVSGLELDDATRASLGDVLLQYEVEVDSALARRDEVYRDFRDQIRDLMRNGDPSQAESLIQRGREASMRVRDLNNRYAKQVEAMLSGDAQDRFATSVRRRSFPTVYRDSYAVTVLDAVGAFTDLDESQTEAVRTIRDSYTQQSGTLNRQMESAITEEEESMTAERLMNRFQRGGGGEGDESRLRDLRRQRRDLDESTVEQVRALLTEQQLAKIPERRAPDEEGDGGRRGRFGGRQRGGPGGDGEAPRANRDGRNET